MNNAQYLNEVQKALVNDPVLYGEVWRRSKENKTSDEIIAEIAKERGTGTQHIVSRWKFIQYILGGEPPTSPSEARRFGSRLRGFLKRHREDLSAKTIQKLEKRAEECDRRASNPQALEEEDAKVEKETSRALESGIAGIYVYTYPHYYRHPVVPETDDTDARTYLKVGMSEKDAFKRVMQQTTGMPEKPMLLQIWKVENNSKLKEIEKKIHDHLRTIGHGGHQRKEWFLTNEDSVESTANLLGLEIHYKHNPETD